MPARSEIADGPFWTLAARSEIADGLSGLFAARSEIADGLPSALPARAEIADGLLWTFAARSLADGVLGTLAARSLAEGFWGVSAARSLADGPPAALAARSRADGFWGVLAARSLADGSPGTLTARSLADSSTAARQSLALQFRFSWDLAICEFTAPRSLPAGVRQPMPSGRRGCLRRRSLRRAARVALASITLLRRSFSSKKRSPGTFMRSKTIHRGGCLCTSAGTPLVATLI